MTRDARARPGPLSSMEDEPRFPRAFGPYLLLHRLAHGGMGDVYLAKQTGVAGLERHVVLKTLRSHLTGDPEYVRRFVDEARVMVRLSHRNICPVLDVGRVGDRYYLAMECILGRDLRSLVERAYARADGLSEAVALHIVCEVLEALDYAHRLVDPVTRAALCLVHRDVSPQNVMVSAEGEVKLIDFGLAASTTKSEQTAPNLVMGKIAYMAPEHARGDPVDARADQFSTAVLAYELLTGARYYDDLGQMEVWALAGQGVHRPRRWGALHPELALLLGRALSADRAARFSSCGDFKEALAAHAFARGLRASARTLRELVTGLFTQELDEIPSILRAYANVAALPVDEATEPFEIFHIATTIGAEKSQEATVALPTAPTARGGAAVVDARPRSRAGPFAAASLVAGLVAGLAAAAGAAGLGASDEDPAAPIAQAAPAGGDPAPTSAAPPPAPAPGPAAPSRPQPAAEAPAAEDDAPAAERAPEAAPAQPYSEPAPPARERPKREPPRGRPTKAAPRLVTMADKLELLRSGCSEPCAADALRRVGSDVADMSPDELRRAKDLIDSCVARCLR